MTSPTDADHEAQLRELSLRSARRAEERRADLAHALRPIAAAAIAAGASLSKVGRLPVPEHLRAP